MEIQQARDALRSIERAKVVADRNSQNNGTVLLVWGAAVFVALSGFDVSPLFAARWCGAAGAETYGPLLAAGVLLAVVLGASWWTGRYVRRLPVTPRAPGNRWLFVPDCRPGRIRFSGGGWALYHVGVLAGGMGFAFWLAQRAHRHHLPFLTFTLIGLADAAPLLLAGGAQWRRVRRLEAA